MRDYVKKGLLLAGVLTLSATSASAATLEEAGSAMAIDTGPLFTMMVLIMTAIGSIWAIKKMISLGNKS